MKLSAGQPEPALNNVKARGAVKSGKKQEAGLSKEPAGKKRKVNLAVKPVSDGEDCSDEEHTANQKNASDSDGDSDSRNSQNLTMLRHFEFSGGRRGPSAGQPGPKKTVLFRQVKKKCHNKVKTC